MSRALLRSLRPHQWVKNLFVLSPIVFAQELTNLPKVLAALVATFLFCLASSSVYLLNDIVDVEADRNHAVKRHRPIASGLVPIRLAQITAGLCAVTALVGGFFLAPAFAVTTAGYLSLNLAYSFRLKRIAYIDVLCIAIGFELRVLAGAFAANVPPSHYLLVVTFLLALFLGFGKRMHEFVQSTAESQRSALRAYNKKTLTALLAVTGAAAVITYGIYTLDTHTRVMFGSDYLVGTTIFVAFGVFRFLQLVRNRADAESPTEQMLRDKLFLGILGLWGVAVLGTIYLAGGSP